MSKSSKNRYRIKTEFFKYLKETAIAVDPFVAQSIQEKYKGDSHLAERLHSRYRFGNSQLRPAQVRLAYELVGGRDWEKTIPACASMEIKDTGYYCLDDVLDSEGDKSLILLGGAFSTMSYAVLTDLFINFSSEQVRAVIDEAAKLDSQNASAALIDLNLKKPNKDLYLQKAKGYNFWEPALKIGAILGDSSLNEREKLGIVGRNIGIGYIIANDTWDFGKKLEDFRSKKYTLPIIYAFENALEEDKRNLESLFRKGSLSAEQIEDVRKIFVRSGAIEYGKRIAQEYCNEGINVLQDFPDSKARRMLEFATTMTQRNRYFDLLDKYISSQN